MTEEELVKQNATMSKLVGATAVFAYTNSLTLSYLVALQGDDIARATAGTHAEQRQILLQLMKELGLDVKRMDTLTNLLESAIHGAHKVK